MNWRPYLPHALGAAAGICLIGFGVQYFQTRGVKNALERAELLASAAVHRADSADAINADRQQRIDSLIHSAAVSDSMATQWRHRALATEAAQRQLAAIRGKLSDSLRLITTGKDSLPVLVRLVTTLTSENGTLRQSLGAALQADSLRKLAVDSLRASADTANARYELVVVTDKEMRIALGKAQQALARAAPPCRVLFWGCPSRSSVAVLGAGLGAGLTYYLTAKR